MVFAERFCVPGKEVASASGWLATDLRDIVCEPIVSVRHM
jgi:hypothetical protein